MNADRHDALAHFHPVIAHWFAEQVGTPTTVQERGWRAIRTGRHALLAAPTGSGKTLAAFLHAIDALLRQGLEVELSAETHVVYVSPLKALSNDIHRNLLTPLEAIRASLTEFDLAPVEIRAGVRTGDTPSSKRQALVRRPPHILVTTPESLYLLLTSVSGRQALKSTRTVIVDEIHALAPNRRGAHMALSLERLQDLVERPLQRIGLSATQRPIETVAQFLVGHRDGDESACEIIDEGHGRDLDLGVELPGSPLEAVMQNEVWGEVYARLAELIQAHRTTLVFVNTRRLAERVTQNLSALLGEDAVTSHHGSLAAKHRLDAEARLKSGALRALVATASLELGIDIGFVDLVCQVSSPRSIAAFLQRVGRSGHKVGGQPKGRLFLMSRDDLVECAALLYAVRAGRLDELTVPAKPLDVLGQQIVATAACDDWDENELFRMVRRAHPYRDLTREEFDAVVGMLTRGFDARWGKKGRYLFHDGVHGKIRARRSARLAALMSGGAIPDNADYEVVLEPTGTFIGTVNEDFAIESMAGDVFQLGNTSWRILLVSNGKVRVEDARGQPPTIPFWLGEAPGRSAELSDAVSTLRAGVETRIEQPDAAGEWLKENTGLTAAGVEQIVEYLVASHRALGALPTQKLIVIERFFDELGGIQVVIHAPFGTRVLRAWGLALRKRFCRTFNFELQAAASDDTVVLSLGPEQTFVLEDIGKFLHSNTVEDVLVQALLDAPMFQTRWRWNASRALMVLRQRRGKKVPAAIQRMEAEDLLSTVFPEQQACLENIVGDRELPDHPLVYQTVHDCLTEAMDIDALRAILTAVEAGEIRMLSRDVPEPSPLAHEVLNAKPYAFLDDVPLEERRTQAVFLRRRLDAAADDEAGVLDSRALERVLDEAWPRVTDLDEAHDTLMQLGVVGQLEGGRTDGDADWNGAFQALADDGRVVAWRVDVELGGAGGAAAEFWSAAERWPEILHAYPGARSKDAAVEVDPDAERTRIQIVTEIVRGRLEVSGPVTLEYLRDLLAIPAVTVRKALETLEAEGTVLRGRFLPQVEEAQWFNRRLLARVRRLTLNQLRAEIQPVSLADFMRFLLSWQRTAGDTQVEGPDGLEALIELLEGFEFPAGAIEPDILAVRMAEYDPGWLDQLCLRGRIAWGRISPPSSKGTWSGRGPLRTSPLALFLRNHQGQHEAWLSLAERQRHELPLSGDARMVLQTLQDRGALFFREIVAATGLLPTQAEHSLGELVACGWATADSFVGLRALLLPEGRRPSPRRRGRSRRRVPVSVDDAGRWSLLTRPVPRDDKESIAGSERADGEEWLTEIARTYLRRWGVVFRRLLDREASAPPWRHLLWVYRRLEARGEIRGGRFVDGVAGEQFALPEAVGLMRKIRRRTATDEWVLLSAADPLNLLGILVPGENIQAQGANRILFRGGEPVAVLEGGRVRVLDKAVDPQSARTQLREAQRERPLPPALRPFV